MPKSRGRKRLPRRRRTRATVSEWVEWAESELARETARSGSLVAPLDDGRKWGLGESEIRQYLAVLQAEGPAEGEGWLRARGFGFDPLPEDLNGICLYPVEGGPLFVRYPQPGGERPESLGRLPFGREVFAAWRNADPGQ